MESSTHLQRGVTLVVALLLLLVVTVVTLAAVRFSSSEVRIALNEQMRINTFQTAQSVLDGVALTASLPPPAAPGTTYCSAGFDATLVTGYSCAGGATVTIPGSYKSSLSGTGKLAATVTFQETTPIPRCSRPNRCFGTGSGDSATSGTVGGGLIPTNRAIYVVGSHYTVTDLTAGEGQGRTQVKQGIDLYY